MGKNCNGKYLNLTNEVVTLINTFFVTIIFYILLFYQLYVMDIQLALEWRDLFSITTFLYTKLHLSFILLFI